MPGNDAMHPRGPPVTAVRNTPKTVEFSGVQGLTLVADEWLGRSAGGADVAADRPSDPHAARRRPEPVLLEEHRPGPGRRRLPRRRAGQPRPRRQRPGARRRLRRRDADRRRHAGPRRHRPAGDPDRGQHGRADRHPRRRPGRAGAGHPAGARRRRAAVREERQRPHPRLHVQRAARVRHRSTRPPTPSPPTCRTGPGRAARRG